MNYTIRIGCFLVVVLMLTSCGKSVADYAQQYCDCASQTELSKATLQAKNGLLSPQKLSLVEQAHIDCMGEDDPLVKLKDSPEAYKQFQQDFLKELDQRCPAISRDMGF